MPPPSSEPVHKGTLVCVVLKARNLPNKKSIGKQDPYTVLTMGTEQQKTKPDKRGGQHPTWDEQLHFEIYEDMEDALAKASNTGSGSAAKSASSSATDKLKGGKKVLKVACYADDSKEPEFIGDGIVDLTDTLKTGEFDEWVTIKAKDRYAGEVYLELTFYSSAAPPKKRKPHTKPQLSGTDTYGGAGTFQRIDDLADSAAPPKPPKGKTDHPPIPASMRPGGGAAAASAANSHGRMSSSMSTSSLASSLHRPAGSLSHSQTMHDLGAGTIRPSSSLANLDAYTPAYAPASISRSTSPVPPSSAYHSAAPSHASHASHASSIGPAAGSSRRNSFAAPHPSEFGHSVTPSASYYAQHSMTPSQSHHHLAAAQQPSEASDDRYATIRPGAVVQQHQVQQHHHAQYGMPRSHSISHVPAYAQMPQPDYGADQLAHSMGQMSFHAPPASSGTDKPLPPPTPVQQEERPPQSHIYQTPAHLASLYTPPSTVGYAAQHEVHQGLQRPVSPAARPASALSQYSTSPAAPHAQSVVNAQAYYQQQASQPPPPPPPQQQQQQQQPQVGAYLSQPQSVPPRAASPGIPQGYTPIPSPYSQPPAPQHHQQPPPPPQPAPPPQQVAASGHVSRPLPSTQSSTSLASQAVPPPHAYSHLYQAVQQPSPPPAHAHTHSYSQSSWTGPPPSQQPAYSAPPNGGGIAASTSGYLYTQGGEGWAPQRSPSPLPPIPQPQNYSAAPYPPAAAAAAGYAYANQPQYAQYPPQYPQQQQQYGVPASASSVYQPHQYHH
ncbi:uncharacterized protein PAN0_023c6107 [Moesziomyces antarcticus]|uniref:Related to calcineurin temperature suppressor cts1 n=2 Tax=Pseudozyma antarctica TaxID=84753 RepID=A0A5C3FXX5_PSEA2|nr:uncharacterized protein PAN0_023c6107 [Moesziomyces antarcticus]GAK67877.1 conserved hypothetical protein [Moesziomyces antarcticus]SPO49198.1 related to calcineurin temperature suppressor cts1 [Moesziomyces antarcticus]